MTAILPHNIINKLNERKQQRSIHE